MSAKQKKPQRTREQPAAPPAQREKLARDLQKRNVAADHIEAVMAMMDPGLAQSELLIPARGAWMRSSTVESTVLKLAQADGSVDPATGRFFVEARARPDDTLIVRTNAADPEDAIAIDFIAAVQKAQLGTTVQQFDTYGLSHDQYNSNTVLGTIAAGGTKFVCPCTSTLGGNRIIAIDDSTLAARIRYTAYTGPIGALVAAATVDVSVGPGGSSQGTLAVPALCTFLGMEYFYIGNLDSNKKLVISGSFLAAPAGAQMGLAPSSRTINLSTLAGVDKLRSFRIAGQSLLLTYTGNMLNNGGEIAIARVAASWAPDVGKSVYESLVLLPKTRRYVGKVAKGAHCFWVPETVEDFDPKLYGLGYNAVERPTYKIVAAGSLDDPTESVMLQLETIVEFQSDAPSYASVSYAPPWNNFDVALYALANINPCGENPGHIKRIKKWTSAALQNLMRLAIANPELVSALTTAATKAIL